MLLSIIFPNSTGHWIRATTNAFRLPFQHRRHTNNRRHYINSMNYNSACSEWVTNTSLILRANTEGVEQTTCVNVNKKVQLDATICRHLFTAKSLYMFRESQHTSSGVLKTVTATSGNLLTKSNHCIFLLHFNYFITQKLLNYKIRYVDTSECVNI